MYHVRERRGESYGDWWTGAGWTPRRADAASYATHGEAVLAVRRADAQRPATIVRADEAGAFLHFAQQ